MCSRGDSNEYTQYTIFNINIILDLQLWDFFQGTQGRVRNSRGKRAINVRATEVLLYNDNRHSTIQHIKEAGRTKTEKTPSDG